MLKKGLGLVVALVLALTIVSPALAITFGQPDTENQYPYVGTLVFTFDNDNYYSCTGTLLSPTVLLTAGHCTEEAGVTAVGTWVTFDQEVDLSTRGNYDSIEDFLNAEWISGTANPYPLYDDFAEWPNTYDVGIVVLDEPVILDEYATLAPVNFLDTVEKGKKQNWFTVVGYGMQGYIKPFESDIWARYYGTVKLVELNSTRTGDRASAKFTNNPGTGGGTCYGDSGGPTFYQDTTMIVTVTSWGWTPCIGNDFNFRVDTQDVQEWILSFL